MNGKFGLMSLIAAGSLAILGTSSTALAGHGHSRGGHDRGRNVESRSSCRPAPRVCRPAPRCEPKRVVHCDRRHSSRGSNRGGLVIVVGGRFGF